MAWQFGIAWTAQMKFIHLDEKIHNIFFFMNIPVILVIQRLLNKAATDEENEEKKTMASFH